MSHYHLRYRCDVSREKGQNITKGIIIKKMNYLIQNFLKEGKCKKCCDTVFGPV